jgi:hypothetical protein
MSKNVNTKAVDNCQLFSIDFFCEVGYNNSNELFVKNQSSSSLARSGVVVLVRKEQGKIGVLAIFKKPRSDRGPSLRSLLF